MVDIRWPWNRSRSASFPRTESRAESPLDSEHFVQKTRKLAHEKWSGIVDSKTKSAINIWAPSPDRFVAVVSNLSSSTTLK